ncbi:MAG: EamA family transporter, partial [Saprospiraceae bacterium]|nr:EamA family transporter [Saprospiraceae bacterium]
EKVATGTYVNPIVALILGWIFNSEKIPLQSIIAAVIMLTGVYFINTSKTVKLAPRRLKSKA